MIAQSVQERRYRRLLRLYPQHYRREYQEEMLAVLLADARPGPAQILDLIRSALAVHGRLFVGDLSGPVWRRAAAVVQLSQFGFDDLVAYNGFHPESVRMLGAGQWAALVLIPVSAFLVAAELNRRLEDTRFRAGATGTSRGA